MLPEHSAGEESCSGKWCSKARCDHHHQCSPAPSATNRCHLSAISRSRLSFPVFFLAWEAVPQPGKILSLLFVPDPGDILGVSFCFWGVFGNITDLQCNASAMHLALQRNKVGKRNNLNKCSITSNAKHHSDTHWPT